MKNLDREVTIKLPESVINIFRDIYGISDDIYSKK